MRNLKENWIHYKKIRIFTLWDEFPKKKTIQYFESQRGFFLALRIIKFKQTTHP